MRKGSGHLVLLVSKNKMRKGSETTKQNKGAGRKKPHRPISPRNRNITDIMYGLK
jgi:hypothetical protein